MKLLKDILYGCRLKQIVGNNSVAVERISFDSRKVGSFALFVAVRGVQVDGHKFIDTAIQNGAQVIVCETLPENLNPKVSYVEVANTAEALGIIASNFYDNPSQHLKLIGITGTNGKTTTATLMFHLFKNLGYKVGLLSTVENRIHNHIIPSTHTTPDPIQLNALLSEMVHEGCTYAIMEVSSHAIHQNRIAGLEFDVALFSNITHDHLDYHNTFKEYIQAKKQFFDGLAKGAIAITNIDDANGRIMVQNTKAKVQTMGLKNPADYKVKILENQLDGLQLVLGKHEVMCKLVGKFNAYNLLAVYAAAMALGHDELQVLTVISTLNPVVGRFQITRAKNGTVAVVDYAHTPDALKNILSTINEVKDGDKQLITLVGCGGDRDKTKRPIMAEIACELSDKVILTSDNPRTENPSVIIDEMKAGVPAHLFMRYSVVENRAEAIKAAVQLANPGDIILIAGKGHETYQEINGVKHHFDDMEIVTQTLNLIA